MKKNKIDLKDLHVTSFVTSQDSTVKGGLRGVGQSEIATIKTTTEPTPMTMCYHCPPDDISAF